MSRRGATLGVAVSLAFALGLGGAKVTVPYVGLGPGPLYNTLGSEGGQPLIVVPADRDHPAKGELNLTTVNVFSELTLLDAVRKWFDPDFAVVPRDLVFPKDQTPRQNEEETKKEMQESQEHAITAALCELGTPVVSKVVVESTSENGPAAKAGILKDDVIAKVDGRAVDSVCTLRRITSSRRPGDTLAVVVTRGGAERSFEVRTTAADAAPDGRPLMGVGLLERDPHKPFPVTIALQNVGGPSAGLMFALGIYDRLTEGDLTGGVVIAGTGTIDDEGAVGPIGGIQLKLAAARSYGARWFLTPAGNYDDAVAARPDGLTLVRIETLKDALDAVKAIAAGRRP
jgi:PDZ domain-containing protein